MADRPTRLQPKRSRHFLSQGLFVAFAALAGALRSALNVVRPAHRRGAASTAARSSGIDMSPLALAISTSA